MSGVWTGIYPYWKGQDTDGSEVVVTLQEQVIYSQHFSDYPYELIIPVDFTSYFESKPTTVQLRAAAKSYVNKNAKNSIPEDITVSFISLQNTPEYENYSALQRVELCDTVTVIYSKLGVTSKAKVVKTVWDLTLDRYKSISLGEVSSNLAKTLTDTITDSTKDLPTTSTMQRAIIAATNLITGGLGGHVVIGTNADGQPNEILVMDTEDKATAVNVLRINVNGIGFSSTGYNGPFTSAWTLDGTFDASQINVINLDASTITTGILKDSQGNFVLNLNTGSIKADKISWTSTYSSMTSDGELTCSKIHLSTESGNYKTEIDNGNVLVYYNKKKVGQVGAETMITTDSTERLGLSLKLDYPNGRYLSFASQEETDGNYILKFLYARYKITTSDETFNADQLHATVPLDMHGNQVRNLILYNLKGINSYSTITGNFNVVTSITSNSDGTITWHSGKARIENGIIVAWPTAS